MALPAGYRNMQYYWSLPAPDHSDPDDCPSVDPKHSEALSAQTSGAVKPTSIILQSDLRNMSLCSFGPVFLGIRYTAHYYAPERSGNFPVTHWLMMGLSADGTFQLEEEQYTQSFLTKSQKVHANLGKIKERLIDY